MSRQVFDTLIGESGKEVYKLLWSNNYFIEVISRCLDTSAKVVPSYQAYAASPEKWNVPVWAVRQEHTITTVGLFGRRNGGKRLNVPGVLKCLTSGCVA
eukprot:3514717-Amphidinium_carterae.2